MAKFLLKSDIDEICHRVADSGHAFAGKSILLTGSRGFLGRYFIEVFARLNEKILKHPQPPHDRSPRPGRYAIYLVEMK